MELLRDPRWFSLNGFVAGSRVTLDPIGDLAGPCFWVSKAPSPRQHGQVQDGRKGAHNFIHSLSFLAEGSEHPSV